MQVKLYHPFQEMRFDNSQCFLSGAKIEPEESLSIFADWLSQAYSLDEKPFKMLDESFLTYADIKIPCSSPVKDKFEGLEKQIQKAFEKGFVGVKSLDQTLIFQWVAKMVYGIIFKEIHTAVKQQNAFAEGFNISQSLIHKFGALHTMLQSVSQNMIFEDFKPFSMFICKVNNAEDEFAYRDEINTLTFSLRMKDFGLLVNLQDNGANKKYHEEIWNKIEGKTLHPIQFEELCAKVFYSAYLFNRLPEYHIIPTDEAIFIEAMPLRGMDAKSIFDNWNFKIYGQVVENFWKRWNFLLLEIIKNPEIPLSYLLDEKGDFLPAEKIDLPLA
jgi:hypothetical protein